MKIGSRKLYSSIELVKGYTEVISKESNPDLTDNEITLKNNQRIILPYAHVKPYDSPTFS